jgi:hypothetical protein
MLDSQTEDGKHWWLNSERKGHRQRVKVHYPSAIDEAGKPVDQALGIKVESVSHADKEIE